MSDQLSPEELRDIDVLLEEWELTPYGRGLFDRLLAMARQSRPSTEGVEHLTAAERAYGEEVARAAILFASPPPGATVEEIAEAIGLLKAAQEHIGKITVLRRQIGPIATQAQTAGNIIAQAQAILSRLSTLGQEVVEAAGTLEQAAAQFNFYAREHQKKGTDDGYRKAAINSDWSIKCSRSAERVRAAAGGA